MVPLFNLYWHFVVVMNVSRTHRNEIIQRGLRSHPPIAQSLGLTMCVLSVLALVPAVGGVALVVAFLFWIAYWIKVASDSRQLRPGPAARVGP
jgi:uncharacterized membrane protein